jgi:hypothetical protein
MPPVCANAFLFGGSCWPGPTRISQSVRTVVPGSEPAALSTATHQHVQFRHRIDEKPGTTRVSLPHFIQESRRGESAGTSEQKIVDLLRFYSFQCLLRVQKHTRLVIPGRPPIPLG